jgi:hypothetical protein
LAQRQEPFDNHPDRLLQARWRHLIAVLTLLNEQTQQKLAGPRHIENRLVSLDDLDARPIQKGKSHPKTEFGTTLQMTVNRQGVMITTENFIGQPNEKTLYAPTLERFRKRMGTYPGVAVTDAGYRSAKNRKLHHDDIDAGAKNLRGFGQSLYRGLAGATIWSRLNQCAYNLIQVLQL